VILNLVNRLQPRSSGFSPAKWVEDHWSLLCELAGQVGPTDWAVDLVLVPDSHMEGLNEDFRHKDGVTDVLSFSYLEFTGDGPPQLKTGQSLAALDLWVEAVQTAGDLENDIPANVGEIVLAPVFVHERCRQNSWSADLELPMLVVHGLLHILGWEHETEADRTAMQDIEESVLAEKSLAHPLRKRS